MHFISYSRVDGARFVAQLEQALAQGAPSLVVWIDRAGIRPGRDWDSQVAAAVAKSATLLFVMTTDSVEDGSICKLEYRRALRYKKPVIPLRVHPKAEAPLLLEGRQWVDFTGDFDAALNELRAHLDWLQTPEGQLQQLEDRLEDAKRDLRRASSSLERRRPEKEIGELEKEFAAQQQVVQNPDEARRRADERIERGLARERASTGAERRSRTPKRVNKPPHVAPDYFQDRRHETALLEEYLRSDLVRLVTITGGSSVGKTAMTCRLLEGLLEGRDPSATPVEIDGVVYLDARRPHVFGVQTLLGDVAELLTEDEADRLEGRFRETNANLLEKFRELLDALAGRRVVVFIDGVEDLIHEDGLELLDADIQTVVGELLRTATDTVKLILTSRRPLPAALVEIEPARQRSLDLDEGLPPPYAADLLRDLDRDGTVGLKDAPSEELDLARRRTNGNPHALEMLYAILSADRHTTLSELLDETAHLSPAEVVEVFLVRATLSRLDQNMRRVVEALAVYQWPMRPEAVDHLLKPYVVAPDSGPILQRLVERQIVRSDGDHFLLPAKYWEAALAGIPGGELVDREPALQPPYTQLALLNRGADFFEQAKRSPDTYRGIEDVTAQLIEFDLRLRGEDYELAAHVLLEIDEKYLLRWGHATEVLARHRALLGKLQDPRLEQASVGMIGTAYFRLGRDEEAIDYFEQALEIARTLEDRRMRKPWITNLGSAYYQLGQVSEARALYEEALAIARAASDEDAAAWPLSGLCLCFADTGDFEAALEHGDGALAIARRTGDPRLEPLEAEQLAAIGYIHGQTGEVGLAKRRLRQARAIAQGITYRSLEGHCLADLAEVLLDENHPQEAVELASEALEMNTAVGNTKLGRDANYILGLAHLRSGAISLARTAAVKASNYAPTRWSHCAPLLRGIVLLRQGETEAASEAFQDALDEADERLEGGMRSVTAFDTKGVALAGLAVCGDEERLTEAVAAFDAARAMTCAKGVIARVGRLLEALAPADEHALLVRVRAAAEAASDPG